MIHILHAFSYVKLVTVTSISHKIIRKLTTALQNT